MRQARACMAAMLLLGGIAQAAAAGYPDHQVKLVVPQAPGGASDFLARQVAQGLTEAWGQTVVVENRAGAGGNIGLEAVARAPADGYTLLFTYEGTQAINVSLRTLPFDPVQDFTPIAAVDRKSTRLNSSH